MYLIYKCNAKPFWVFCQGMDICATRCFVKTFRLLVMLRFELGRCFYGVFVCVGYGAWVCLCIPWNFFWRHQESVHKTPSHLSSKRHHSDLTFVQIEPLSLLICSHSFFDIWQIEISSPSIWYVLAELKMHLLPVANCDGNVFDITRGLVQCRVHVQACGHYVH